MHLRIPPLLYRIPTPKRRLPCKRKVAGRKEKSRWTCTNVARLVRRVVLPSSLDSDQLEPSPLLSDRHDRNHGRLPNHQKKTTNSDTNVYGSRSIQRPTLTDSTSVQERRTIELFRFSHDWQPARRLKVARELQEERSLGRVLSRRHPGPVQLLSVTSRTICPIHPNQPVFSRLLILPGRTEQHPESHQDIIGENVDLTVGLCRWGPWDSPWPQDQLVIQDLDRSFLVVSHFCRFDTLRWSRAAQEGRAGPTLPTLVDHPSLLEQESHVVPTPATESHL